MRVNRLKKGYVLGLLAITTGTCHAVYQESGQLNQHQFVDSAPVTEQEILNPVEYLPYDLKLSTLLEQLNKANFDHKAIDSEIELLSSRAASFNYAEQYLFLLAQGLYAQKLNNIEKTINYFEQAIVLSEQLSKKQLAQPLFKQLHTVMADAYAENKQYEKAFLSRREYLKSYNIYRSENRKKMIDSMKENHEIEKKNELNKILTQQNKQKERVIEQHQAEKEQRRINFTIILATAVLFILLMVRQVAIRKRLLKLTKIDSLTGVYNRHSLFRQGQKMIGQFRDNHQEFTVLLLDLDHFKSINDNYGHQVGDQVLIKCAQLICETMRTRDVFSRLGGEEFAALLPFADHNKAKAIAERILEKIAHYDFSEFSVEHQVTTSIGVATMESAEMSFDDILHCADLAMYQAKEQGRNRVVSYHHIAKEQERRTV
ncbi:GGDEF domain-containing protein [Colwellia sp. RSH04]|uniref:GGDEF domain-containing protein n=1 Tax=Colwellia sp. RSH04 TaxID=2305464 RepID=UPI000E57A3B4|nr:GGDEF domain-containing protein [Colwellia sp. RSH04]RHW77645.1 GGDEF domain-containing protein [Colwellia sp. RSH04]